jgi:hypothetical protein
VTPITLTVPMPPNIANRQMHHMVKHRVKVGYWALLDLMLGFGYDARLLALDGPCGGLPPDMKLDEWVELYRTLNAVRYATPPAHV